MGFPGQRTDKFSISYSIWIGLLLLLFAYADELDRIFNLSVFIVPIVLTATVIVALTWLASLIASVFRRYWRRVVSVLVAPLVAGLFFWTLARIGVDPERIRFEFGRQYYLDQVAKLPDNGEPKFKTFDWGSRGWVLVSIDIMLVYDETDLIGLSPESRSDAWHHRIISVCREASLCALLNPDMDRLITIKRMRDHFYVVTQVN